MGCEHRLLRIQINIEFREQNNTTKKCRRDITSLDQEQKELNELWRNCNEGQLVDDQWTVTENSMLSVKKVGQKYESQEWRI